MSNWHKTAAEVAQDKDIAAKRKRQRELQGLLDKTDHKLILDYQPRQGENVGAIKAQRSAWRQEIREIINQLEEQQP